MRIDPMWRRAPLVLRSHPGAAVAITAAVLVLAVASASAPLLVSSAGGAAYTRVLRADAEDAPGLLVTGEGAAAPAAITTADRRVRREVARLPQLGAPVGSLTAMAFQRSPDTTGVAGPDGAVLPGTLTYRDGLLDRIRAQPGSRGDGDGLWLPDALAEAAGVAPGDRVTLLGVAADDGDAVEVTAAVGGTYRDPFDEGLLRADAPDVWRDVLDGVPRAEQTIRVPPLLLADRTGFLELSAALDERVLGRWTAPVAASARSLTDARALDAGLQGLFAQANDPTSELIATLSAFARPGDLRIESPVPDVVSQASAVADALAPPLRTLAVAAQAVALLLVAAAVALLLRRRRHEVRLLATQGASPVEAGARTALEVLPATMVGAVAGWLLSAPIVRLLGPSPDLDPAQIAAARGAVLTAMGSAPLVAGAVGAAAAVVAQRARPPGAGRRLRWVPWEPVALALAVAAGYQLVVRGGAPGDPGAVDLMVVAFPLLAVAAIVGLAVRAIAWGLGRVGTTSGAPGRSVGAWLAVRRIARLPGQALVLLAAAGMALGLFVYFSALAVSTGVAIEAKGAALAGAETASDLFTTWRLEPGFPSGMPDDTTFVWRDSATIQPGDISVDLLAVDPASFARGAAWRPSFADQPLTGVLDALDAAPDGRSAAVVAVGADGDGAPLPARGQLVSGGWDPIGFEVALRPEAFPGMREGVPLVVVDARRFFPVIGPYDPTDPATQVNPVRQVFRPEIWSAGTPAGVERYLASRETRLLDVRTRAAVATRPELLAPTWTLAYLQVLGAVIGALALGALVVYADQRRAQRSVAYALARRMGLSARSNFAATAAELLALLAVALVVGALAALGVGALIAGSVDPAPGLPPAPRFVVPLPTLGVTVGVLVAAAVGIAGWLQVRADRTDVAEVLRVAE